MKKPGEPTHLSEWQPLLDPLQPRADGTRELLGGMEVGEDGVLVSPAQRDAPRGDFRRVTPWRQTSPARVHRAPPAAGPVRASPLISAGREMVGPPGLKPETKGS